MGKIIRRTKKVVRRTGKTNLTRDRKLLAKKPGKRISKSGKVYYENRRNRSDIKGIDTPLRKRKKVVKRKIVKSKKLILRKSIEPLRGVRRHDLLPLSIRRKIPKLYSQDGKKDPMIYLKLFSPYSQYTFYVTEFDGNDTLYGYVSNGQDSEWGYSSFKELVSANRRGLPLIERDKYFSPKKASKISDIKRLKR